MKYWKKPKDEHIVYEAFTAIVDGRVAKSGEGKYKCFSSSGNKFYSLILEKEGELFSFMSNDNMAYYRKEFSYPMLAVLILEKLILVDMQVVNYFEDIFWKEINTRNKNDYMKSVNEVLEGLEEKDIDVFKIKNVVSEIFTKICNTNFGVLGDFRVPENKI
jgi:hypothetical protein